jgi:hypothetical protein
MITPRLLLAVLAVGAVLLAPAFRAVAVDTGVTPAILSVHVVGPVGAGTVAPSGVRQVYEAGDEVAVVATPADGCLFSGWALRGNGTIDDSAALTATVALVGNVELTAYFRAEVPVALVTVRTAVEPALGGTVDPADPVTATAGELIPLVAAANPGYQFLHWTVAGAAEVTDTFAAATTAAISGPAAVTAVFGADAEVSVLDLDTTPGGTVRHLGIGHVATGGGRAISAVPEVGFFFQRWQVDGDLTVADEYAADTMVTVDGDGIATAVFLESCDTFSHLGRKLTVRRKVTGLVGAPPRDGLILKQLPLCLRPDQFNPNTDEIVVTVDGIEFVANAANGVFKRLPLGYTHTVKDPVTKSRRKLMLDFTRSTWSFQASKVDLAGIDNRDGLFVAMHVNGSSFGQKYDMLEAVSWKYDAKKNTAAVLPSAGEAMAAPASYAKVSGRTDNRKANKDNLKVSRSPLALPGGRAFDPGGDAVVLRVDRQELVLPPGSFIEIKPGIFQCLDVPRGIKVKIDQNTNRWTFEHKKFSGWSTVDPATGVAVVLSIGEAQSGFALGTGFSQRLTYDYRKFYWSKPVAAP